MWFWKLLRITFAEWWRDNTFRMAAALAFYTIFSLSPLLVIAVSLAGLVVDPGHAERRLADEIGALAGPEAEAVVEEVGAQAAIMKGSPLAIAVGVIVLVVGSTVVFAELQSALNEIWDVHADPERSRRFGLWKVIRDRLLSFGVVVAVAFLLLVSLAVSAALAAARDYFSGEAAEVSELWRLLHQGSAVIVISAVFALIYRLLPDVRIGWRDVAVGAVVTSILFNLGKFLIGLYLGQAAIGSTYGAAGSFGVFLIWVYYSALIYLFGAEFTQVYARRYGSGIRPKPHAVRVGRKRDQAS